MGESKSEFDMCGKVQLGVCESIKGACEKYEVKWSSCKLNWRFFIKFCSQALTF